MGFVKSFLFYHLSTILGQQYYLAKYYILLEHLLYITWAFIIYYLGKYYYIREFSSHAIRHWGGLEAIIGVYITLSAPVVLLKYMRCVVVQVWLTNAKKAQSLLWNCAYEDGCLFQKIVTSLPQLLPLQPLPEDS